MFWSSSLSLPLKGSRSTTPPPPWLASCLISQRRCCSTWLEPWGSLQGSLLTKSPSGSVEASSISSTCSLKPTKYAGYSAFHTLVHDCVHELSRSLWSRSCWLMSPRQWGPVPQTRTTWRKSSFLLGFPLLVIKIPTAAQPTAFWSDGATTLRNKCHF